MTNKELEKKLFLKRESSWITYNKEETTKALEFCEGYKTYIDNSKTERLCVKYSINLLEESGFKEMKSYSNLKVGDKFYKNIKGRALFAGIVGEDKDTFNIVGAHVDSPRLDLKPNPLFEDSELALLKTHYYGGVKKYQWVNQPLSINGVVFTTDGREIPISIGDRDDEPKFMIPDLLIHLSQEQAKKDGAKVVEGEQLNLIVGSIPVNDDEIKEKVKFAVLEYLYKNYNFIEEDFNSADISITPAGKAMDIGFDRSLIAAYGHDDRVCAYPAIEVIRELKTPLKTAIVFLSDKEEVGSAGDTGADSNILLNLAIEYKELVGSAKDAHLILEKSQAISSDVTAGVNPNFKDVHDLRNAPVLGKGVGIAKYTGSRGKSGAHDSGAEFVAYIRTIAKESNTAIQSTTMGKIDLGGGGTIAKYLSKYGMDVIDAGPALLGMHSPYEVASKVDIYSCFKLYKAFLER
ncbi:aminopeptidase [Thiospirochaeta perfilievii]|uniref:M18 family aminopeptidase n=1 Tax=Thiospirochaeta perfilievii TaxID=252967 RepID=A0A5C1QCU1_9SPIO|nr:aminopeptidase [Thiospirochaeta perfilievii]QEN05227.1 aminopeptidase [Thiospirochaeta perfilievii]